ncbi:MAG: VWA domain-containing protein [Sphingobacteriales bacterium]|jgi:Ca-activated chloride channel family protein|nr:MAG: VWA domain-containing protein [Sphingobacteriales bacterium]
MKKSNFLFLSIIATALMFFTLSAKKSSTTRQTPDNNDEQNKVTVNTTVSDSLVYNGKNFAETKKGKINLGAGFQNDYYMNDQKEGFFYTEVKADKFVNENNKRLPLNISLVIDRSGSMSGDKIRYVKDAAKFVIDNLTKDDIVSIIIYDDEVEVLQAATKVENKQLIKNKINTITDRGSTNLTGGMLKGYAEVKSNFKQGYINRVLLLSDGLANEGITDPIQIQKIVSTKNKEDGISLSTFGVGNDYNEDLMTSMAEQGTGNYYFIDSPDKIPSIFEKELKGLMTVVAQNVSLEIQIPANVEIQKVYGYKYEKTGNTLKVNFRDVFSEEVKGILIKYKITNNATNPISFTAKVAYDDATSFKNENLNITIAQQFTENNKLYIASNQEKIHQQITLFEANENLENAMREVDKGNYEEAKKIMETNKTYLSTKKGLVEKSEELQKLNDVNLNYDSRVKEAESMSVDEIKFMQKSSKSQSYQIKNKK